PAAPVVPPRARGRRMMIAAFSAVLVAAGVAAARAWRPGRAVAKGAEVIAVMPLGTTGDSGLVRLGRDLVVTVSTNLDGVGTLRAVDPMSVLQRSRELPQPIPLDEARKLAADLGASSVVHGSVIPDGAQVRVDIGLYPVGGGDPLARSTVKLPAADVSAVTDSISVALLRQVWRDGKAPSPYLAEVATASGEALRAFLEGEALLERFDVPNAIAAYRRATAADSMFAQAWFRIANALSITVQPADTAVERRLDALEGRLPERDRALRQVARLRGQTILERTEAYGALAARYPEYYLAQYRAGDPYVHELPRVGRSIATAMPYLERLEALAPGHADNAQHRLMLAAVLGDSVAGRQAAADFGARAPSVLGIAGRMASASFAIMDSLHRLPSAAEVGRIYEPSAELFALYPHLNALLLMAPLYFIPTAAYDSMVVGPVGARLGAGHAPGYRYALGVREAGRGDFAAAVATLAPLESLAAEPSDARLSALRAALYGAWTAALPVTEAEAVVRRVGGICPSLDRNGQLECRWAEGTVAVLAGDRDRLDRITAPLVADTQPMAAFVGRSLRALWAARRDGDVAPLAAEEDAAMARGLVYLPALPIVRPLLVKAAREQRRLADAERYAMWVDAVSTSVRPLAVHQMLQAATWIERARTAVAAGDAEAARRHYDRFLAATYPDLPVWQRDRREARQAMAGRR
ncbi:MAG: hypothetical protein KJT01_12285, partial [Gemmatimonadetes bacterium]|nr:hypothetical protein [Gemmatimonadota bacterium]